MKKRGNRRVALIVMLFIIVSVITAGIAYGASLFTKSLNAKVNVVGQASFAFYSDDDAEHLLSEVGVPDVSPGGTATFTFYVKNTSTVSEKVFASTNTVPVSIGTLTLKFDGQNEKILAPGAITKVVGTLTLTSNASVGLVNFSLAVSAEPIQSSGTTTNPPPTTALNGQQIFAATCICHSLPPNTTRTQTQLLTFIPGHNTGSSLTTEEVAAVAAYIRP